MVDNDLILEIDGLVARLTVNRPETRNPLGHPGNGTMANFDTIMEMSAALPVTVQHTEDQIEALIAFFEKRTPQFKGR